MALNDPEKLSRIEELKSKLFSKNYQPRIEHRDNFTHHEVPDVKDSWQGSATRVANLGEKFFMQTSLFKKFFIFSAVFFGLTLIYASYVFFAGGNVVSNDNIEISVLGNTFTAGGEEMALQISIANKNNSGLELADLIIQYPKNSTGDLRDTENQRISLGSIAAGSVRNENVKVVLYGEQGSVRPIKITLEYRVEGSNAIFLKEKIYEVNINSTPIDLTVTAPPTASSNQEMSLTIKTALNSNKTVPKMLVKVDYPVGFQFISASPTPASGNNVWNLGDVAPGATHEIAVVGKMVDVFDGEEKTFKVWTGSQSSRNKSDIDVVFNSLGHTVTIQRPYIEANLYVNGLYQREYTVDAQDTISGEIRWVNNLDTKVNDLEITAKISGTAVDEASINAERGFYDSSRDMIIWDKTSQSRLAEVNPGDTGSLVFNLKPRPPYTASTGIINSPAIKIDVKIAGKQSVEGYELRDINNGESKVVKIISDVGFIAKALYYTGPFQNSGPIPPKAEKETTYTIVWSLSNTSNPVSRGVVKATLPSWVKFVGNISPASADLSYNSSTREITWNVGSVPKGAGITAPAKEVAFKMALTPSLSQVNTSPALINEAVLTGHDDFANVDVRVSKLPLFTRLPNDPQFPANGDRVVE